MSSIWNGYAGDHFVRVCWCNKFSVRKDCFSYRIAHQNKPLSYDASFAAERQSLRQSCIRLGWSQLIFESAHQICQLEILCWNWASTNREHVEFATFDRIHFILIPCRSQRHGVLRIFCHSEEKHLGTCYQCLCGRSSAFDGSHWVFIARVVVILRGDTDLHFNLFLLRMSGAERQVARRGMGVDRRNGMERNSEKYAD